MSSMTDKEESTSAAIAGGKDAYFTTPAFEDAVEALAAGPAPGSASYSAAVAALQAIVRGDALPADATADLLARHARMREEALFTLARVFASSSSSSTSTSTSSASSSSSDTNALRELLVSARPFFASVSKPRAAKAIRSLIDTAAAAPGADPAFLVSLCEDAVAWCRAEKRTFLRQRLQARLAALYRDAGRPKDSLALLRVLVREVKKLDDKPLLVEACLVETSVFMALRNVPRAKAALTAARANANGFYCPPLTQASIDLAAGVIAGAEKDHKTAFSYYYEAHEGYTAAGGHQAAAERSLKLMLMSKVLAGQAADVPSIASSKAALRCTGDGIPAMRAVAAAFRARSVPQLEAALAAHAAELSGDEVVAGHLATLRDGMVEQQLLRLLEPFSRVQLAHVAAKAGMTVEAVEARLGQMILDGVLSGILDQGAGDVVLFDRPQGDDAAYTAAASVVKALDGVVDRLARRADKLVMS